MKALEIDVGSGDEWIAVLKSYERNTILEIIRSGASEVEAAEIWLSRTGPDNNVGFGAGPLTTGYFASIKAEFNKLICGHPEYKDLRSKVKKGWDNGKLTVVSAIASSIAVKVGVAVAVLMPVVALLLAAVVKIGTNAWCNVSESSSK